MADPKSPIRMTPAFFFLMLSLTESERHGHAMAKDVEDRSGGSVRLGPGSLYWSLSRLADVAYLKEVDPPEGETDERRRFYALTRMGREVLAKETATLERIVDYARLRGVV
ncbi:MAG: PadR family transcriptional regulator [Longimicrobiales bacterium]